MKQKATLKKQIIGAVIGSVIAVVLYTGYEQVTAYLVIPQVENSNPGDVRIAETDREEDFYRRANSRQKQIANLFTERKTKEPVYEEVMEEEQVEKITEESPAMKRLRARLEALENQPIKRITPPPAQVLQEVRSMPTENLPESGFGISLIAASALGGAYALRKKKKA